MPARGPDADPPVKKDRRRLLIAAGGGVVMAGMAAWRFVGPSGPPPETLIETALARLDAADAASADAAGRLARRVAAEGFRPTDFPGAAEFVQGIAEFRAAESEPPESRTRRFAAAVRFLRAAERQGLPDARRPEWSYSLGMSLSRLGRGEEAKPLLESARWSFPAGRVQALLSLSEAALTRNGSASDDEAAALLDELAALPDPSAEEQVAADRLRTRVALRQGRIDEAEAALTRSERPGLSDEADPAGLLLRAELWLARGRPDDARRSATAAAAADDTGVVAAAAELMGRASEASGDADAAIRDYERAADLAPNSPAGAAAALAAAALLRKAGRDEEALDSYRRAVRAAVAVPPAVTAARVREAVLDAWNGWSARSAFDEAAAVAEAASPVIGNEMSLELRAKARLRAAESVEAAWQAAGESERRRLDVERRRLRRASGEAFAARAAAATNADAAGEAYWTAAGELAQGHAFAEAEAALTAFLDLDRPALEAAALVRRGEVRLDLGRPAEAADDFRQVIELHPTDPAVFAARDLRARSLSRQGKGMEAEAAWRELLASSELTPEAPEWRSALFSLAASSYRRGTAAAAAAERAAGDGSARPAGDAAGTDAKTRGDDAAARNLDEAIARWGEFVTRAPSDGRANEARVLRADALRRRADALLMEASAAETDSLRRAARSRAADLLAAAATDLETARDDLSALADADRLSSLGTELMRSTEFDLGQVYADLGRPAAAVVAFAAAVNRFPDDPRAVTALLRTAAAYRALGKDDEARGALRQGRLLLDRPPEAATATAVRSPDWAVWLSRLQEADAMTPAASPLPTP